MVIRRVFAAVVALIMISVSPAWAHTGLVSSDPADGAVLLVEPTQVLLQFNEDLLEKSANISIRDDAENVVGTGEVQADGGVVSMPWPANLPDGAYRIAYRVVSADGHPVTGEIGIVLNSAGDLDVAPAPAASSSGLPTWLIGVLLIALLATVGLFIMARRARR
jgi:copper resistance protein C